VSGGPDSPTGDRLKNSSKGNCKKYLKKEKQVRHSGNTTQVLRAP
jgi:hypothetical protein